MTSFDYEICKSVVKNAPCFKLCKTLIVASMTPKFTSSKPKIWLLGDSAYGLITNLMTPIPSPTTPGQRRYNRAFLKVQKQSSVLMAFGKVVCAQWTKQGVSFLTVRKSDIKLLWQLWYCITFVSTTALILTLIHSMNKFMRFTLPILQEMEY